MNIREAIEADLDSIKDIYNQGIEDRIATLETETKDQAYMEEWFAKHNGRYKLIVAEQDGEIVGWSSLNQYNSRKAYKGVADLSVYISRDHRGKGIGGLLLQSIEEHAKNNDFNKIVLFTFTFNQIGQGLYKKQGFREVGVFKNQGFMDGEYVDVMAMEKLL
ncbi:arsinothricin resistance N-acetyltransferase ArsN1 family A [Peribacillus frigoritolerans]|uniref:arsinothricin resistance N-acetyltransferase ArsN1 family A n=1 Tax=Peribacillus frigoritolerans TaxID=450367 RepID=UPI0023DAE43D|nr:arsinothricin resistance N-acetyltransferase ArsN1 family A [Peribacillus frigoritolerans]MDF2000966.1 arsinothricin resistance N-acetyltransferase ArsN1 [Peribacillus frigoritolerans]